MFSIAEVAEVTRTNEFREALSDIRQSLAEARFGQQRSFSPQALRDLRYFVECVLVSAPDWDRDAGHELCRVAAEISELLSESPSVGPETQRRARLRSALLCELADLPAIAGSLTRREDISPILTDFFRREGRFASLRPLAREGDLLRSPEELSPGLAAVHQDAVDLSAFETVQTDSLPAPSAGILVTLAEDIALGLSATELRAFASVVTHRASLSTRVNIESPELLELLGQMDFPAELWSTQRSALRAGLLDPSCDSWGLASPTGTGKTFLTRLLIADSLRRNLQSQVLYVVPSKALVYEVSQRLAAAFDPFGLQVMAVTPQLVALDEAGRDAFAGASVLVLTPEKADLLVRLGPALFSRLSLVVIDEAHHIEAGTRGALLELYLWRLRRLAPVSARFVFLSAVTPNIGELVAWAGRNPRSHLSDQRATRMRVGVYSVMGSRRERRGVIRYSDGTEVVVVPQRPERNIRQGIGQLARAISGVGPVLTVAKGKRECERLATLMLEELGGGRSDATPPFVGELPERLQRLDSRLEREMYADVALRSMLRWRIAYHHAGLPPRVRVAVEDAIRGGFVDYVFATTTLAEGVNFPFSSVIVQSVSLRPAPIPGRPVRYQPVTPRTFWNIAGRAGRPGFDKEGQVILFEPSLGLERIGAVIGDYLKPGLNDATAVSSALGNALSALAKDVRSSRVRQDQLNNVVLSTALPSEIVGTLNLVRIGLVHGRASGILQSAEAILEGSFAASAIPPADRSLVNEILRLQGQVVDRFFEADDAPTPQLVAELGLSLETLTELRRYVRGLDDWQITRMGESVPFGSVRTEQARFVVRAVATRMTELEGGRLGDLLSEVIMQWLAGVPFTTIRRMATHVGQLGRLEDLISVVYSRVQYLLPWGLYALHRLLAEESVRRNVQYDNQVQSLAYLADAGVPTFEALRLVYLDFERVDATRLAQHYRSRIARTQEIDLLTWIANARHDLILQIVRGAESRRVDFDLDRLLAGIRAAITQRSL